MKDHVLGVVPICPACGTTLGGAFNTESDRAPQAGDPTLCCACRALLVFSGSPASSLRYPTPDEEREFLANANVQRAIAALAEVHRSGNFR